MPEAFQYTEAMPDPATLPSEERIRRLLEIRARVNRDRDSVTDDEVRYAVMLVRAGRREAAASYSKKKGKDPVMMDLSSF